MKKELKSSGAFCAALVVVFALASCFPTSKRAALAPDGERVDPELFGLWRALEDESDPAVGEERAYLQFTSAKDDEDGMGVLVIEDAGAGDAGFNASWSYYEGPAALSGDRRFISLQMVYDGAEKADDLDDDFIVLRYGFSDDDTLWFRLLDTAAVAAAIQSNTLKGKVEQGTLFDSVRITSSSAELFQFLSQAEDALFVEDAETLTRVRG